VAYSFEQLSECQIEGSGSYCQLPHALVGVASGSSRVLRGGSWASNSRRTRSAFRYWNVAGFRYYFNGFRLVRELD
jgi:formylglycine-generating enzyme required for sulfatase activity